MRFASHSDEVSVRDPRFRAAVADVAAPLRGIAKDDLIGEEVRQHKRTMRIARAAGILLALLAAVASVAAVLAVRSADRANRERDRAEREGRVATSRQLAAESTVALQGNETDGALDRAATAWRTAKTTEARDAVLAALKGASGVEAAFRGPTPRKAFGDPAVGRQRRPPHRGDPRREGRRVPCWTSRPESAVGEPLALPRPGSIAGIALDAQGNGSPSATGTGRLTCGTSHAEARRRSPARAHKNDTPRTRRAGRGCVSRVLGRRPSTRMGWARPRDLRVGRAARAAPRVA